MSTPYAGGVIPGDFLSAPKLNRMFVHVLTGAEMISYSPKYDGMAVVCSLSGSGYSRGFLYLWDNVVGQFRAASGGKHTHSADDESSGGLFSEVLRANLNKAYPIDVANAATGMFQINNSTGSATNDWAAGRMTLDSGAANGGYVHVFRSGIGFDLTRPIELGVKAYVNARTFLSTRIGVCGEHVNVSHDDLSKFGIEACDSANVAKNWDIFSATGALSSRTISTTTENAQQSSPRFFKLLLTPGQTVGFGVNGPPSFTKSANVPGSGRTSHIGAFSAGIKTNTSTARIMYIYAVRGAGTISDTAWM